MLYKKLKSLCTLFFVLGALNLNVLAQDTVNLGYTVTPKDGMVAELEAAIAKHLEWRISQGDPWTWNTYDKTIGTDILQYAIRSPNHAWSDFDEYDFAPKGQKHFVETVAPFIENFDSGIDTEISEFANWDESQQGPPALVQVINYDLKPGAEPAFMASMQKVYDAIKKENYPVHFGFLNNLVGLEAGTISAVITHNNWASMQEPEENMMALMNKVYGEKDAQGIFKDFMSAIDGMTNEVWAHRPDLSTPAGN